jgi:prepilin-type N-terminal cleavage/methylation domain-containing protein
MEKNMKAQSTFNNKGITLIELLVAMVIATITLAGIYRVFISQTKTYAIQDQVVEVQQSVRGAMDMILRDLQMTGFDDDNPASVAAGITVPIPITAFAADSITVNYEYFDRTVGASGQYQRYTVVYLVNGSSQLTRQLTKTKPGGVTEVLPTEVILPNVNALNFTYGVDANNDGFMDDQNGDGVITAADYVAAGVVGTARVIAIRVQLTAMPERTDQDITKVVSPRTLASAVTLRNLCLR